jgi:hypothetical protein
MTLVETLNPSAGLANVDRTNLISTSQTSNENLINQTFSLPPPPEKSKLEQELGTTQKPNITNLHQNPPRPPVNKQKSSYSRHFS